MLQARQILLRRCPRQVADNLAVNLYGDSVRVIRVRGLWNQHRHDVAADPVSDGPARQTPQGVLIGEFADDLKVILSAQQRHRYSRRLSPRGHRRLAPAPQAIQQPHLTSLPLAKG